MYQRVPFCANLLWFDLGSRIDTVELEVEALRRFLGHAHADFPRRYPALKQEVVREVDPEWTEASPETKSS